MPGTGRTHYQILGVSPRAGTEEIRRAYHRLARELHPDHRPPGAPPTYRDMQDVNEAWRVLRDPVARAAYDRRLAAAAGGGMAGAAAAPRQFGGRSPQTWEAGDDLGSHVVRGLPWLLLAAVLVAVFVFTAYAGSGGSGTSPRELVGSCVRIPTGQDPVAVPCDRPNDGEVVLVSDRTNGCPPGTRSRGFPGDPSVLCLASGG